MGSVTGKIEAGGYLFCCPTLEECRSTSIERLNFNQWLLLILCSTGTHGQLERTPCRHVTLWSDDSELFVIRVYDCTVAARAERHLGSLPCSLLSVSCRISLQPPDVTSFMTVSSSSFCEVLAADLITSCNRHLPLMAPPQQPKAGGKPACCLLVCSGEPSAERWGSRVV